MSKLKFSTYLKESIIEVIDDVIADLNDLKEYDWSKPYNDDLIQAMAETLKEVGIEPTDMYAAIGAPPEKQEEYLVTGPGSYEGSEGALRDLIKIRNGERDPIKEARSEETPTKMYSIGELIFDNPYGTGRKYFQGIDKIEAKSPDDALNKYIRRLVVSKKIPTSSRILYRNAQDNGVKVKELPPEPKKEVEYWWQKY